MFLSFSRRIKYLHTSKEAKEVAEIIKGNCGNLVYLISTELAALEEISKMCGEVKSKEKDKTASTPLVTVSDLQKLKLFQAIIIRLRMNPFKTKLEPDFKMDWGMTREEAYDLVQPKTAYAWDNQVQFRPLLEEDPTITSVLSKEEIDFFIKEYTNR